MQRKREYIVNIQFINKKIWLTKRNIFHVVLLYDARFRCDRMQHLTPLCQIFKIEKKGNDNFTVVAVPRGTFYIRTVIIWHAVWEKQGRTVGKTDVCLTHTQPIACPWKKITTVSQTIFVPRGVLTFNVHSSLNSVAAVSLKIVTASLNFTWKSPSVRYDPMFCNMHEEGVFWIWTRVLGVVLYQPPINTVFY
jgi:hypothetical protein